MQGLQLNYNYLLQTVQIISTYLDSGSTDFELLSTISKIDI